MNRTTVTAAVTLAATLALAGTAYAATPVEIAHRGGDGGTAEETSPGSLYRTYKAGIRYAEMDVWINKEGKEFLLHDTTLDRTTDCTGNAVAKTMAELEACGVMSLGTGLALVKKYSLTVYLHQKGSRSDKQAKEIAREVSSRGMATKQVRYIADSASTLRVLDKYVDHRWLGLIVNHQAEWADKNWSDLFYYAGPITKADVAAATKRGQRVTIIQNPAAVATEEEAQAFGPFWGWMKNADEDVTQVTGTEPSSAASN